jgi:hypothetical protein
MPLTEELSEFFNVGDHATAVTFTPAGGSATTVNAIFQNEFFAIDGGEVAVNGTQPIVVTKSSDVTGIANGDTFTINSTGYTVVRVEPDGTGVTQIALDET